VARLSRWFWLDRREPGAAASTGTEPPLPEAVQPDDLFVPWEMNLDRFDDVMWATGGTALWDDYEVGQRIDHAGGATIAAGDDALLARLVQSAARFHLGQRAINDLHVVSVARAIAHDGLENVLRMAAWNRAVTRPVLAGDTIRAWTEVLGKAELPGQGRLGAVRLRLVAVKNADPALERVERALPDGAPDPRVVVDLDWWGLVPRHRS
jgi:2-methylfumaryl-CoA hydratase